MNIVIINVKKTKNDNFNVMRRVFVKSEQRYINNNYLIFIYSIIKFLYY